MDTLRGVPEGVEEDFASSIDARDEAIALLSTQTGLGRHGSRVAQRICTRLQVVQAHFI